MNEEKLKAIWNEEKTIPLKNINTELIGQRALESQNKLRKKIKWDIAANILFYILISPIFFYFPKVLIVMPFAAAIWIWYLWEMLRIYNCEIALHNSENVKTFLEEKENLLANYIKRTRYILYLGMPIVFFVCYTGMTSFEFLWEFSLNFVFCLILVEILIASLTEIYIRKIYAPVIDELTNLLQQLNDQKLQ